MRINFEAKKVWWLLGLLVAAPATILASEWSGYLTAEFRAFERSPLDGEQKGGASAAAIFESEFYHEWDNGDQAFEFIPYFRIDSHDEERDLIDIRELSYLLVHDDWEFRLGISKVFWGVAESQHLVDTINQTDLVANPDGEDKLGQPMLQTVYVSDYGDFSVFILPGFRERTFPGREGRLRSIPWVDTDNPIYESGDEDSHVDFAFRWSKYIGDFDIGFHYFRGTNRDPDFIPGLDSDGNPVLRPFYEQMDQVGLDLQYTREGWLWKLEALGRETSSKRYSSMVGGFEYTLYGLFDSSMDLGLLAEIHLDSRGLSAPNPFNRDLFAGGRLTWNDEADTSLIAGAFYDPENGSTLGRIEWERRLKNNYKLEIEAQKLTNIDSFDPFFSLRRDSFLQVSISRYY